MQFSVKAKTHGMKLQTITEFWDSYFVQLDSISWISMMSQPGGETGALFLHALRGVENISHRIIAHAMHASQLRKATVASLSPRIGFQTQTWLSNKLPHNQAKRCV